MRKSTSQRTFLEAPASTLLLGELQPATTHRVASYEGRDLVCDKGLAEGRIWVGNTAEGRRARLVRTPADPITHSTCFGTACASV